MEWWYKSSKYSISPERTRDLKVALYTSGALQTTELFTDGQEYYIKTSNNIRIHSFLYHHGFDEIYDTSSVNEHGLDLL